MKHPIDHAGAPRIGEEFAVIADEPARGREEDEARLAGARRPHVLQLAFALADLLHHYARVGLIDIDGNFFDRLQALARVGIGVVEYARPADRELEAFAPHGFNEHTELQFTAPGHFERGLAGLAQFDCNISFRFTQQPVADHAALHLVAFAPRHRGIIDRDG